MIVRTPSCFIASGFLLCFILEILFITVTQQTEMTSDPDDLSTEPYHRQKRLIYKDPSRLWNKGVVPYTFSPDISQSEKRDVYATMALYEHFTPIRFIPVNSSVYASANLGHEGFAHFVANLRCHSASIGFSGSLKEHDINCCQLETCIHEIGHLLGFEHEHKHPDRNDWIRMNWDVIKSIGEEKQYEIETKEPFVSAEYDYSSFMHYPPVNTRDGLTFTYLFPGWSKKPDHFYMFKELCQAYKCQDYPQCQGHKIACFNDGYVSVVSGQCSCLCPPGLDPSTRCATLLKQVSDDVKMPQGRYALLRLGNDCPDGMTKRSLDTPNGKWSVCEPDATRPCSDSSCLWPPGSYCALKHGMCPQARGAYVGKLLVALPAKTLRFCCFDTGLTSDAVSFPTHKPFSLFMGHGGKCQQITGMRAEERKIPLTFTKSIDGPFIDSNHVYACDYTPVHMHCGDIVALNDSNSIATIKSKCQNDYCDCTWLIKADGSRQDGTLVVKFKEFDVESTDKECVDSVEVRHSRIGQPGMIFCGKEVKNPIRSIHKEMMIRFQASKDSHFKATVTWKPASTWCYNSEDKGQSYNGKVSHTRRGLPCVSWKHATNCHHNPYNGGDVVVQLEENYCRNPDKTFQPWCYTDVKKCHRDFCDVCYLETSFDDMPCKEVKDRGLCDQDVKGRCPADCSLQSSKTTTCPFPYSVLGGVLQDCEEDSYGVGEKLSFKCMNNSNQIERMCLSNGQWSSGGTACTECPLGFGGHNGKCYKFVREHLNYPQASKECTKLGATLAMPKSDDEINHILSLRQKDEESMWLGAYYSKEDSQWHWEDGTRIVSLKLDVPGKMDTRTHYVELLWTSKTILSLHFESLPFVCETNQHDEPDCADFLDNCPKLLSDNSDISCHSSQKFNNFSPNFRNLCRHTCGHCVKESDKCKQLDQAGQYYGGKVSRTQSLKPCVPWDKAIGCQHNPYNPHNFFDNLESNYCRSPDGSDTVWCYTDVNGCQREFCDVCLDDSKQHCDISTLTGEKSRLYKYGHTERIACSEASGKKEYVCLTNGQWLLSGTNCTECPVGYTAFGDSCYTYVDEPQTYELAEDVCEQNGGQIAMAKTSSQNQFLHSFRKPGKAIWLGGQYGGWSWNWADGTDFVWTNWESGRPPSYPPFLPAFLRPNCVIVKNDPTWKGFTCSIPQNFVCQTSRLNEKFDKKDALDTCSSLLPTRAMCDQHPYLRNLCTDTCNPHDS